MNIVKWVLSLALGAFLIVFGVTKFTGGAHIFPYIEYKAAALGFPMADVFFPVVNYATGLLEIAAGLLVIAPFTRVIGSKIAVLPLFGAVIFHLSPLLGVKTPDGFNEADAATVSLTAALEAGGPFLRDHFSAGASYSLFSIAAVMLAIALANTVLHRR